MKQFFLLATGALLLLPLACNNGQKEFYLNYFQNGLDMPFPQGTRLMSYFDSKDVSVIAAFQLPKDQLGSFIENNHFKIPAKRPELANLDQLDKPYRNLPPAENQVARVGRQWAAVIDKNTGLMWCQIIYKAQDNDIGF